jgi:hypothetical protein
MSSRETVLLVSALAAVAALFPAFFSYFGKDAIAAGPIVQLPTAGPQIIPGTQPNQVPVRAIISYVLAVPRAIISLPSKPLSALASLLLLIAAPALVVLDKLLYLVSLPFRVLSAVVHLLYPIYVLCGAAVLTGVILGGLVVGLVKFVLLVQEVRNNRAEMDELNQWKGQRRYYPPSDEYY